MAGYCNEIILLIQSTSPAGAITLLELIGITNNIIAVIFKPIELFILSGIIYMMLTFVLTRLFNPVEYKIAASRRPVREPAVAAAPHFELFFYEKYDMPERIVPSANGRSNNTIEEKERIWLKFFPGPAMAG
ncbi:MAG: hypothetical protein JRE58_09445 [Deltaproteobacteria bacterium]|nr:hypothetical protein [Deltaproteobacteria bacterium]MBW2593204.1 hypothetical protein [Deltaproteobacteria bacterium]